MNKQTSKKINNKKNKIKDEKYRKAVFAVTYYITPEGKIEYLILKRKKHWKGWEFPKGKIEKFETKKAAARREVNEETGLKVLKVKRFKEHGSYLYLKKIWDRPDKIGQTYHLFAVQVEKGDGKLKLDPIEHNGHKWASFNEAIKILTWPNQKKCMKIVNDWLIKKKR
ncbi:MAG: RNA pyrophosphohydrolase [Candidatus Diapherotrites archaeon ADurb.Bin253]|jgi:8-oxo-dGTP pyrophosphatase MutT (NUDIX family)|nr:NUDIX domain-containing protein [Candidatus Pacearchaeota archaeon]OQA68912.1 MAG: RNA pyrophosphohydrolase [Candidatus Diapherotrites archaeon ADurb.Bin253]HNZ51767.1 NUDIX domain-containing protein [Candidatus Pacearchaeota archaeon]HOC97158.1 NUDIX domain-containing protein [Candidatus Pacearchaeota archaeon]HOF43795.1 NUDIX domain-containing protein [Candidatus Pacearchaeota archaeon]